MADQPVNFLNVHEFDLKKVVTDWDLAYQQDRLLPALRSYWKDFVPLVCRPSLATEAKSDESRDKKIAKYLFGPLERFLCGDEPEKVFSELREKDKPQHICGHVFKSGEPTYSCRDCGMDPTCVLCIECFENSAHRTHRYRMSASGGGGYCDCGDVEAWKSEPFCDKHRVNSNNEDDDTDVIGLLPNNLKDRAAAIFNCLLRHALELLVWEADDELPEGMHVEELNDEFVTMLFNDEVHTYEQVISTLKRAVRCSHKEAVEYATTVDREGRSCVCIGKYTDCEKAKGIIEKNTSRLGSKPLKVQVLHSSVVSQQMFAVKIQLWLQAIIAKSKGMRELFCQVSMEPQDNHVSLVEELLRMDTSLWKAARVICQQTVMSAILISPEYKRKFAILFTILYPVISADYIKDDHDHSVCAVSESVQLFTVPSLARMLIKDCGLLNVILSSFYQVCESKKKQNGKFGFDRTERSPSFRRAQYMLRDLRYALSVPPEAHEWNDDLRRNYLSGFSVLLQLLSCMQGMDAVTRQTGQHIEFEPEWEGAFNLQLRLDDALTLFLAWCASDHEVLIKSYCSTLDALYNCRDARYKLTTIKLAGHEAHVLVFDAASQPVSIHLPLSRLLAGLHLHLSKYGLSFSSPEILIKNPDMSVIDLFEHPLRVQVLIAQTHAGMWRRNGFSLVNQIYFYSNVKCRREMYDRDIVMLQAGGAMMDPDQFIIHLINKYGILALMKDDYDHPHSTSEDLVRQVVIMAEEFLNLLIIIIGERYDTAIGDVQPDDVIKREIVHQLCISPLAHSELSKVLPDDPNEDTDLDKVIHDVATFRQAASSGKGLFELKPEFYSIYNPYFYHYHRSDQTKSEEEQRKRKKAACKDQALPPPCPPPFKETFKPLLKLLSCDVMIHIMKLILKRTAAPRSRSWSEAQVERVLHLIGLALHEDKRAGKVDGFPFLKKAFSKNSVFSLLEALSGHENVAHDGLRDLLNWVLGEFAQVMSMKDAKVTEMATPSSSFNDDKLVREREKKKAAAEKRRKQLLAQMSSMQKNFILENADLFESTDSDLPTVAAMEVGNSVDEFPVCVGAARNKVPYQPPTRSTCILCQEQQEITSSGRAMVLATYSQKSTVLSRQRGVLPSPGSDQLFMPAALNCGTFTSTCGHVMHADCWQRFFDSVVSQERRRMFRFRHYPSFDVEKMEFLCPLCETISNSVMPIIPPMVSSVTLEAKQNINLSLNDWLDALRTTVESCVQQSIDEREDDGVVYVQLSPLQNILQSVSEEVARNFTILYETPMEYSPEAFSDSISQMVRKMARDIYSVNVMSQPEDENQNVPVFVWQTCAYSIQVLEQCLRDEGKPLFGALSSRQNDCLSALVKFTAVTGQFIQPDLFVKMQCIRLLCALLPSPSYKPRFASPCILDMDVFHLLLSLSVSLPVLYSQLDKPSTVMLTCGDVSDLHLIELCLVALIVQCMLKLSVDEEQTPMDVCDDAVDSGLLDVFKAVRSFAGDDLPTPTPTQLSACVRKSVLPFIRCTALFYHFLTGVHSPNELRATGGDEFAIICRYLALPGQLSTLFSGSVTQELVKSWCVDQRVKTRLGPAAILSSSLTFKTDINQLVDLPPDYSQLINKLSTFTCPNSDGDDSRAPTMCLVCGSLLCSQSYCCQMDLDGQSVGAATYHAHSCGAGIGILLRVRECQILLLAGRTKGCLLPAPYLDRYGETDQGLRRGNPLFLSNECYHKLQKLWLSHGIPEEIAHHLESNTTLMTYEWQNL